MNGGTSKKALFLLAFAFLFNYDLAFLGRVQFARDRWYQTACPSLFDESFGGRSNRYGTLADPATSVIYNEPMAYWVGKKLRAGELPLWSNQIALGTEVLAKLQTGVLFPLNWVQYIFASSLGIDWASFLKVVLAFLSMFFFLHLGFKYTPVHSLVGAVIFGFTGHSLNRVNMNSANVYVIVPLYLLSIQFLHERGSRLAVLATATSAALIFLAGFPQAATGAFLLGGGFHLASVTKRRDFFLVFMAYGLALLFAAPQLLPFIQVLKELPGDYRETLGTTGLDPWLLVRYLVFPERPKLAEYPNVLHPGWAGALTWAMALSGVFIALVKKDKRLYLWFAVAALYFCKAVNMPYLSEALLFLVPPIKVIYPTRDLSIFLWVPLSIFPVYFLENFKTVSVRKFQVGFSISFFIVALICFFHLKEVTAIGIRNYFTFEKTSLWNTIFLVAGFLLFLFRRRVSKLLPLFALAAIFLITPRNERAYRKTFDSGKTLPIQNALTLIKPEEKLVHAWTSAWCPSQMTAPLGYNSLGSVEPIMPKRFFTFMNGMFPCLFPVCMVHDGPRIAWDMTGSNYFLSVKGNWDPEKAFGKDARGITEFWSAEPFKIYKNEQAIPKAFATNQCKVFESYKDIPKALKGLNNVPKAAFIDFDDLPKNEELIKFCAESRPLHTSIGTITRYSDSKVSFDINLAEKAVVVLSDMFSKDWIATVDGMEMEVFPVHGIYRGVWLPAGQHSVTYYHRPLAFYLGVFLFLIGITLGTFLLLNIRYGARHLFE